jgi:hypothetical protein
MLCAVLTEAEMMRADSTNAGACLRRADDGAHCIMRPASVT